MLKLPDVPVKMKSHNVSRSLRSSLQIKLGGNFYLVRIIQIACGKFLENSILARYKSLSNSLCLQHLKLALPKKGHSPH